MCLRAGTLLFEVLHIIALYPTPHRAQRVVIIAAMLYVAAQVYSTPVGDVPLAALSGVASHIFTTFAFTVYVLYAEGTFPDHWRRVRDEGRAVSDVGGLDNLPSNFPLTKKLWWTLHTVSVTPPPLTTPSTTLAPSLPLEDILETHRQRHRPRTYHPRVRSEPSTRFSCARSRRRPRNIFRCGPVPVARAIPGGAVHSAPKHVEHPSQYPGSHLRWLWRFEPRIVARPLGALERCIHRSQTLGVRI
jgi:hypothetical protein